MKIRIKELKKLMEEVIRSLDIDEPKNFEGQDISGKRDIITDFLNKYCFQVFF